MNIVIREARSRRSRRVLLLARDVKRLPRGHGLDAGEADLVRRARREGLFGGAIGEVRILLSGRRGGSGLALLGVGERAGVTPDVLRRVFGRLARRARHLARASGKRVDHDLELADPLARRWLRKGGVEAGVRAMGEGWELGGYEYDGLRSKPRRSVQGRLALVSRGLARDETSAVRRGLKTARALGDGLRLTRDLANTPGGDLPPTALAAAARRLARQAGLACRVLGRRELEKARMGALLGVARGSRHAPCCIVLEYGKGRARREPRLVLVGKGVTFDSGGISLKPARGMEEMKFDMAGGAAVLGAMAAIARLAPPARVVGIVPAVENLPGGNAIRPGDVLRSASGKTIEVINTDAEGRLILADALWYARRFRPDAVVDIATLTGACVVALGSHASALMANDRALRRRLESAARSSGERIWPLPLWQEHSRAVKGRIADLKNSAGRDAGAITAGAFLAAFAEGLPWAHLDIAGTAWTTRGSRSAAAGATGVGVRLLTQLALDLARRTPSAKREVPS